MNLERAREKRTALVPCQFSDDLSLQPPQDISDARQVASYLETKLHTASVASHCSHRRESMMPSSAIATLGICAVSGTSRTHSHDLKSLDPSCMGYVWPSTEIYQWPTSIYGCARTIWYLGFDDMLFVLVALKHL